MKVIAFNASPRANGNTARLLQRILGKMQSRNIETEFIQIGGELLHGCTACSKCRVNRNKRCSIETDAMNGYIEKMTGADGIIIGSPTYFANVTTETKALIDRAGYVARGNGNLFSRKVGAAVVSVRRAGAINVFQSINNFFLINDMVVPGSSYWNIAVGRAPGEVENDGEGLETMDRLADNLVWLLNKVRL